MLTEGPAGTGEAAAQLRRCTELWKGLEGRVETCGALIGPGPAQGCSVCAGSRCYEHCGSVDHLGGTLYVEGGASGFTWRVRQVRAEGGEFDMGRYAGHLRSVRTGRVIARGVEADDPEEVMRELLDIVPREPGGDVPRSWISEAASAPDAWETVRRSAPAASGPAPTPLAGCKRSVVEAATLQTVVAVARMLRLASGCSCSECLKLVRLFNLTATGNAAGGKAVR